MFADNNLRTGYEIESDTACFWCDQEWCFVIASVKASLAVMRSELFKVPSKRSSVTSLVRRKVSSRMSRNRRNLDQIATFWPGYSKVIFHIAQEMPEHVPKEDPYCLIARV